jgi:hypothetical protein
VSKRRRPSARELREAELGRFELPSFAAGMAIGHLETTLRLLDARQARHGSDPYLDRTREEVRAALDEAQRWQRLAADMLNYPYRREGGQDDHHDKPQTRRVRSDHRL